MSQQEQERRADVADLARLVNDLAWLVEHSRCRFTVPELRARWIVRKQAALKAARALTGVQL